MAEKRLQTVALAAIRPSRFNTRRTRPEADVEALAQRIARNGFEVTRAPWVYPAGDGFEVFAGGTRVEAARKAELAEVPVFVHEGYSWDDIARLADEDNENDEYHRPVPIVDVWAEYARLVAKPEDGGEGWQQQDIAKAKRVTKSRVSERIRWHKIVPENIKVLVGSERELKESSSKLLAEDHIRAFYGVVPALELSAWLTTEQVHRELVAEVLSKHRGSSKGERPSVKVVLDAAHRWKDLIAAAEAAFKALDTEVGNWQEQFVAELVASKARTVAAVEQAKAKILTIKQEAAEAAAQLLTTEADDARRERERIARIEALVSCIALGDARQRIAEAPAGFHLLLTDPPYGAEFRSNRRTTTPKKAAIAFDEREAALTLLRDVLTGAFPVMAENATALVFTGWRHEPEFRQAIEAAGFTIKGSLVWVKHNHGTGDLVGSFAPKHERIIHAVKGSPVLLGRPADVLHGKDSQNSDHPTEKPRDLLRTLIEATTEPGQVVVDPFAGSGNVLFEAHELGRKIFGIELEEHWQRKIVDRLHGMATEEHKDGVRLAG